MDNEAYSSALKNALLEIRNVCPEVQSSFLFDKEVALVTADPETPDATLDGVSASLEGVLEKADAIGGLESLVIEGTKGNVHVSRADDLYLAMIASQKVDMKYLETVARVLIPTVIKLLDNLNPASLRHTFPSPSSLELGADKEHESEIEETQEEEVEGPKRQEELEFELPSNQLIVESFGGLLVRNDTVQMSRDIVSQWEELLDGEEIEFVEVESFNGKASQCKVKIVDNSKLENKAVIRIPEKLCKTLDIKKGELVRVKPVIS